MSRDTILTDDERNAVFLKACGFGASPGFDAALIQLTEAAVLAKLAQQTSDNVLMVTTAYEQGVGKGHQARQRGAEIGNPYADGPCREAWGLGYEEGKSQADRQQVPDEPDWRHPRIQALIGADARNRICIDLVWRILEDPNREFTAGDMEYWDKLHDKVQEVALAAAPEAPAQAEVWFEDRNGASRKTPDDCVRFGANGVPQAVWVKGVRYVSEYEAPAQASAVDERAAFEAELSRQCFQKPTPEAYDLAWCMWQARAALAQKSDRKPLTDEQIWNEYGKLSASTSSIKPIIFARGIEHLHGIDAALAQKE